MLHAATARAGVGGCWPSVGSNQAQFRPRTRRGWIADASCASHQFFFPMNNAPRFGGIEPAPKICDHASFEEEGGNVGAGPQKSLTLF
jgi:hypothetical protein